MCRFGSYGVLLAAVAARTAFALQPTREMRAPRSVERRDALLKVSLTIFGALTLAPANGNAKDFGCTELVDDYYCKGGKLRAQNGLPAWTAEEAAAALTPEQAKSMETCGQLRCGPLSPKRPTPVPAASDSTSSPPPEK